MKLRFAAVSLVAGAAIADSGGQHALAYYALAAALPVAAVAGLVVLGGILDGSAAEPLDRTCVVLSGVALPLLLLATAARAPLAGAGPPPVISATALVSCLVLLGLQGLLAGAAALVAPRPALD